MDARDEQIQWLRVAVNCLQRDVAALSHGVQVRDRRIRELEHDKQRLEQQLAELRPPPPSPPTHDDDTSGPTTGAGGPPPFVKPPVPRRRRRKRPGREDGHEAALRPPPPKVDRTVRVPLPRSRRHGKCCCPHCRTRLTKFRRHRRLVEDLVPARVRVTCYRTRSGWCPRCRRRVESRHPEQPPPADVPHAQVGVNALATAAVLRVENRLPLRQVSQVLADLPGLRLCAGAVAKQVQRLGRWLGGEWEWLKLRLRASADAVNADETTWRTAGRNQHWLWTLCDARHTLYHVSRGRGGRVIRRLLGGHFGGTLVSDFYAAYDTVNCEQQKCLTHLLRELRETAARSPPFAAGRFHRRCKRLAKDLLHHKTRWDELDDDAYTRLAHRLEQRLAELAAEHLRDHDPDARRLAQRLTKYRRRLTTFLWDRAVDGTNNAAERALRPLVVSRKISGGSRSAAGARATAVLASVIRTARQQGRDVLATLKRLLMDHWAGKEPGRLLA